MARATWSHVDDAKRARAHLAYVLLAAAPALDAGSQPDAQAGPWRNDGALVTEVADAPPPRAAPIPFEAPSEGLAWRDEWGHAGPIEYVLTLMAGGVAIAATFNEPPATRWRGNAFDDGARRVLRLSSSTERKTIRDIGHGFFYGLMAYPVLVDGLLVALPQDSEVAWQMLVMDGQALASSAAVTILVSRTTGRERPYVRECGRGNPDVEVDCGGRPSEDTQSFPSGHAMMSFTGAGLICAHHAFLPLYGGGAPDAIACGVALAGATFEGTSRILSDRHYVTDVLVGASLGLASGLGLPIAWHYGRDATGEGGTVVTPYVSGSLFGVMGTF